MAGLAARRAARYARRAWPFVLAAYRRWDRLPPEEKERYRKRARETAKRGRKELDKRRPRRKR
jgi:TRAP-type C4-dicarboxylate transport system substrate-binding protein